ncbi:MAG: hypothetical protein IJT68_04425 [Lentisphaeria bacterium]|nr:hypothetical protein [Lentisphaeria bacterium]
MLKHLAAILLLSACILSSSAAEYAWFAADRDGTHELAADQDGAVKASARMPGNLRVYRSAKRETLAPDRTAFQAGVLEFPLKLTGCANPVKAWIYAKDKEGNWFQSEREYAVPPGAETVLELPLDEPGAMLPVGHNGAWTAQAASAMFEYGVTLFGEEDSVIELECRPPAFSGARRRPALRILDWELPASVGRECLLESHFRLSREYFNPFDPDEIRVDYELETLSADGKTTETHRYPAYFTQDFTRSLHFARESVRPSGQPYWAFRMTPHAEGKFRVRLVATDNSDPEHPEEAKTEWRTVEATPSDRHGSVRVCASDPRYFEHADGTFYYPLGLNIHANADFRSEMDFPWHHVPDRKTYDYDDYFEKCGKFGIDLAEIWMASWTCAIEWTSAMDYFYGVGRYNQANAWRLDRMFEAAARNGVLINLVFDSHGKLSTGVDPEWQENPFNDRRMFKIADGAFLNEPRKYWTDPAAIRLDRNRARYIAARWGSMPNLFAYEYMSEINLVDYAETMLKDGTLKKWTEDAAAYLKSVDQGGHLVATHVSGNADTNNVYRDLFLLPQYTHVVGDAYRGTDISFLKQLAAQERVMAVFRQKPVLITEFGEPSTVHADIHAGLWGAPFFNQAGTPMLWWHDKLFLGEEGAQYPPFAAFIRDLDFRNAKQAVRTMTSKLDLSGSGTKILSAAMPGHIDSGNSRPQAVPAVRFVSFPMMPDAPAHVEADPVSAALFLHDGHAPFDIFANPRGNALPCLTMLLPGFGAAGWIYDEPVLFKAPADPKAAPLHSGILLDVPPALPPGKYRAEFYDTWQGGTVAELEFTADGRPRQILVPPFRVDIAFKLRRVSGGERSEP